MRAISRLFVSNHAAMAMPGFTRARAWPECLAGGKAPALKSSCPATACLPRSTPSAYRPGTTTSSSWPGAMTKRGWELGGCGTCMDARGITPGELAEGSHRGTMDELTEWVATSDRVLSF